MSREAEIVDAVIRALGEGAVDTGPAELDRCSRDESDLASCRPVCVCRPGTTADVVALVRAALDARFPIVPRGGGTGLEGGCIPSEGAVVADLSGLDAVARFAPEERFIEVGPGMVNDRLNRLVGGAGLFFPPSPGGSGDGATVGGMVSTDASGLLAFGYGSTRRWVASIEAVTGAGEVLRAGSRVPKSSAGYDLKDLIVGSEGTLAIVTSVGLRLAPLPLAMARAAYLFDTLAGACEAAATVAAYVPGIAALEVVDAGTLALFPEAGASGNLVICEVHGTADGCREGLAACADVFRDAGGRIEGTIADPWELRHRLTRTVRESAAPVGVVRTDCAVPLPSLGRFATAASENAASHGRRLHVFGHAGTGILHFLLPLAGPGAWTRDQAQAWKRRLDLAAIAEGGTSTGEHGVGTGHRDVLAVEHPGGVAVMRAIKAVFDPAGILNPGKVV